MSSCCPAWVDFATKNDSDLLEHISKTPSPVAYTAEKARVDNPNAKIVFIAPCVAKKRETLLKTECDYSISFEEFGSFLVASGIEISQQEEYKAKLGGSQIAKNFAQAGGVAQAVKSAINIDARIESINGLDKSNQRIIKNMLKKKEFDFLEVMACEGGCLGGCQNLTSPNEGLRIFDKSKE
jgi:iron only hydrogenase large subunit-like protein